MPFSSAEGGILQHYYSQSGLLHVTVSEVSISKMISTTRYNLGSYNCTGCWMLWKYLIKLQSNIFKYEIQTQNSYLSLQQCNLYECQCHTYVK